MCVSVLWAEQTDEETHPSVVSHNRVQDVRERRVDCAQAIDGTRHDEKRLGTWHVAREEVRLAQEPVHVERVENILEVVCVEFGSSPASVACKEMLTNIRCIPCASQTHPVRPDAFTRCRNFRRREEFQRYDEGDGSAGCKAVERIRLLLLYIYSRAG